jgi:hypothetical protein
MCHVRLTPLLPIFAHSTIISSPIYSKTKYKWKIIKI